MDNGLIVAGDFPIQNVCNKTMADVVKKQMLSQNLEEVELSFEDRTYYSSVAKFRKKGEVELSFEDRTYYSSVAKFRKKGETL